MNTTKRSLISHLTDLKTSGKSHITLSAESKAILRSFFRKKKLAPPTQQATAQQTTASPQKTEPIQPVPSTPAPQPPPPLNPPTTAATTPAPSPPTVSISIDKNVAKEAQLQQLQQQAENWELATSLGSLRKKMVFSTGSPDANIMFIGEAPGFQEERQNLPFVGEASDKLNGILKAMGLSRDEIYLTNLVKFRPAMKGQTTNNRKPTKEEVAACLPLIKAEIDIVQPKLIIALGATAAEGLLQSKETVGKLRNSWHQFEGLPLRVSYHPSYLLHNESVSEKRKVWEDMLAVMEKLGLPISEKQRNFFRK